MKHKTAGKRDPQRVCPLCKGGIAEVRPVWLLVQPSGNIVGPYHAGCAAKLSALYAKADARRVESVQQTEMFGHMAPKEDAPW